MKIPNIKITYKVDGYKLCDLDEVAQSHDVARIMRTVHDDDVIAWVEESYVLALNRSGKVIGSYKLSKGSSVACIMDTRALLLFALTVNANALIISHNHPSGHMKPSKQDTEVTSMIKKACEFIGIKLLDHVIVSPDEGEYFSFADEGLL